MVILVTGGLGYIGCHTVVELLNSNFEVIIVDNLVNTNVKVLDQLKVLSNKQPVFYQVDINDYAQLSKVFELHAIDGVIHFAALKAVGESVNQPMAYYKNNVHGSMVLFQVMQQHQVKKIVFSSSATVYGNSAAVPIIEDSPLKPTNPYGWSKFMIEQMLRDMYAADKTWSIALLRYFNPVGAHSSGLIGECPNGTPNNLMPYITQVAIGRRQQLNIYGNDYPTHDGTGVRDYIHVVDLARGHLQALNYFIKHPHELLALNLGTGIGYSVLDVVKAFEIASGRIIKHCYVARREGDSAICYANPSLAEKLLGFKTHYTLEEMCRDSWNFQLKNPNGYI
ncbi:MAG: UDP-glucose 4-epimerase GalE [Burkholderiales bacterium]|nr:UDP-glucose 4-epimerase GalE [Burkholderiales bacterium]